MTDNSGLVMNRLSYRQRITVLFPYLSTSLALSPLTSLSCTADCTVNSPVLQGHHLSLPTLALRCLAYLLYSIPLSHLMWGQNMNIDYRDLREVQTKRSQYSLLAHYITTDWLTASYGDFFIGFRPPLSVPLVCMWFFCLSKLSFSNLLLKWVKLAFLKSFLSKQSLE